MKENRRSQIHYSSFVVLNTLNQSLPPLSTKYSIHFYLPRQYRWHQKHRRPSSLSNMCTSSSFFFFLPSNLKVICVTYDLKKYTHVNIHAQATHIHISLKRKEKSHKCSQVKAFKILSFIYTFSVYKGSWDSHIKLC